MFATTDHAVPERRVERFGVDRSFQLEVREATRASNPFDLGDDSCPDALPRCLGYDVTRAQFRIVQHERAKTHRFRIELTNQADFLILVLGQASKILRGRRLRPGSDDVRRIRIARKAMHRATVDVQEGMPFVR